MTAIRILSKSFLLVGVLALVACSPAPSPTPVPAPTQTRVVPTTRPTRAAPPPLVKILGHPGQDPKVIDLWLEFTFNRGQFLSGTAIDQALANGELKLTLADGSTRIFEALPPPPRTPDEAQSSLWLPAFVGTNLGGSGGSLPLDQFTFENQGDFPSGPHVRIPLEEVMQGLPAAEYQINWHSGDYDSGQTPFTWDGAKVTEAPES